MINIAAKSRERKFVGRNVKAFIEVLDEMLTLKADELNVFSITALILTLAPSDKRIAWKELFVKFNERCLPSLQVSLYSDGRDGLNARNELFNAQHDGDSALRVFEWGTVTNKRSHADGKRSHLQGLMLTKETSKAIKSRKVKLHRKFLR